MVLLRDAKVRTWCMLNAKTLMQPNLRAAITAKHNLKCLGKTHIYEVTYSYENKKASISDTKVTNTMKS